MAALIALLAIASFVVLPLLRFFAVPPASSMYHSGEGAHYTARVDWKDWFVYQGPAYCHMWGIVTDLGVSRKADWSVVVGYEIHIGPFDFGHWYGK